MTETNAPEPPRSRARSGPVGCLLESAGIGCLAPIGGLLLVVGGIAAFGWLPIWALYACLGALLAIGVLAMVVALRQG